MGPGDTNLVTGLAPNLPLFSTELHLLLQRGLGWENVHFAERSIKNVHYRKMVRVWKYTLYGVQRDVWKMYTNTVQKVWKMYTLRTTL